jgi:hypothetical protein
MDWSRFISGLYIQDIMGGDFSKSMVQCLSFSGRSPCQESMVDFTSRESHCIHMAKFRQTISCRFYVEKYARTSFLDAAAPRASKLGNGEFQGGAAQQIRCSESELTTLCYDNLFRLFPF